MVEMLALRMELLFDSLLKDERLLRVAMQLLGNVNVGPQFAHVLLNFLVDKQLPSVQQPSSKVASSANSTIHKLHKPRPVHMEKDPPDCIMQPASVSLLRLPCSLSLEFH